MGVQWWTQIKEAPCNYSRHCPLLASTKESARICTSWTKGVRPSAARKWSAFCKSIYLIDRQFAMKVFATPMVALELLVAIQTTHASAGNQAKMLKRLIPAILRYVGAGNSTN